MSYFLKYLKKGKGRKNKIIVCQKRRERNIGKIKRRQRKRSKYSIIEWLGGGREEISRKRSRKVIYHTFEE